MIFDLVKRAKDIFINKANTGVEADNVEDAISVLNSNLEQTNSNLNTVISDLDTVEGKWVKSGIIEKSNVNVALSNNSVYLVFLSGSSANTSGLCYIVWVYGNQIGYNKLFGTPVETSGSRYGIVTVNTTMGIYAQNTISIYTVFRLK